MLRSAARGSGLPYGLLRSSDSIRRVPEDSEHRTATMPNSEMEQLRGLDEPHIEARVKQLGSRRRERCLQLSQGVGFGGHVIRLSIQRRLIHDIVWRMKSHGEPCVVL